MHFSSPRDRTTSQVVLQEILERWIQASEWPPHHRFLISGKDQEVLLTKHLQTHVLELPEWNKPTVESEEDGWIYCSARPRAPVIQPTSRYRQATWIPSVSVMEHEAFWYACNRRNALRLLRPTRERNQGIGATPWCTPWRRRWGARNPAWGVLCGGGSRWASRPNLHDVSTSVFRSGPCGRTDMIWMLRYGNVPRYSDCPLAERFRAFQPRGLGAAFGRLPPVTPQTNLTPMGQATREAFTIPSLARNWLEHLKRPPTALRQDPPFVDPTSFCTRRIAHYLWSVEVFQPRIAARVSYSLLPSRGTYCESFSRSHYWRSRQERNGRRTKTEWW